MQTGCGRRKVVVARVSLHLGTLYTCHTRTQSIPNLEEVPIECYVVDTGRMLLRNESCSAQ